MTGDSPIYQETETQSEVDVSEPLPSPVDSHLEGLINRLSLPRSWIDEGITAPSLDCCRYAYQVLQRLFDSYGIIPYKVTASKESGVYAAYKNPRNNNILRIEIDDELDVVAVVSDGNRILDSGVLEEDDLERSVIHAFDPELA